MIYLHAKRHMPVASSLVIPDHHVVFDILQKKFNESCTFFNDL